MNSNSFSVESQEQRSSLFPIASSSFHSDKPTDSKDDSLRWLTNQSYAGDLTEKQSEVRAATSDHKKVKDSKDHKRSHQKRHVSKKSWSKNDSKTSKELSSKHVFLEDTGLLPQHAFRIDRKSDRNNLAFTSLYYLYVANYDKSKTLKSAKLIEKAKKKLKSIRYHEDKSLKNESQVVLFNVNSASSKIGNFVPLNSDESGRAYAIYDYSTSQYIQGKGVEVKTSENKSDISFSSFIDPSNSLKSSKNLSNTSHKQIVYNKTQELNKYLKENPNDVNKWLELIEFQDEFFKAHESNIESMEKGREVQILEKKLSIVEKALENNPKNTFLNVNRLEILKKFWEPEKVMEEWKKLSFIYPNVPLVWERYINFLQTNISFFSFQSVIKVYCKCISTYSKMLEGFFQSHSPPDNLENEILKVTLMYCEFLEQCGYTERAFATWQALIEFNVYTPLVLNELNSLSDWLMYFEAFWDSGVPRFGEDNAKGWTRINNETFNTRFIPKELSELEDSIISQNMSRSETWLAFEDLRESYHWLPLTTIDEDSVDDMERNVFFDDIKNALFRLKTKEAKLKLIEHFFTFMRLADTLTLLPSSFLYNIHEVIPQLESCVSLPPTVDKEGLYNFTINCFNQAIQVFDESISLRKMLVKFQLKNYEKHASFESAKICIQNIVCDDRFKSNLFFWKCLAELYQETNNKVEMRRIYEETILSFVGQNNKCELLSFIVDYIKCMLGINSFQHKYDSNNIVVENSVVLKTAVTGIFGKHIEQINALQLLKVKRLLEVSQKSDNDETTVHCIVLQALINYLNANLEEVTFIFENFLSNCRNNVIEEEVYQNYVQLCYFDTQKNFQSFSTLRRIIQRALSLYPNNAYFLDVFIATEMKSALSRNIRRFFSKILNQTQNRTLQSWLFAIFAEWKRLKNICDGIILSEDNTLSIGVVFKIRSLFEKALSCQNTEDSVLLWRLFLKFEACFGGTEKAMAVYYRAVQRCPWSKVLYKDGIRYFSNTLQDILDVMNEKEIKVRTPVEEVDLLLDNHIERECHTSQRDASHQP